MEKKFQFKSDIFTTFTTKDDLMMSAIRTTSQFDEWMSESKAKVLEHRSAGNTELAEWFQGKHEAFQLAKEMMMLMNNIEELESKS